MRPSLRFAQRMFGRRQIIGAEIGVEHGINAIDMFRNWNNLKLYLVEIEEIKREIIREACRDFDGNFEIIIGDSAEVSQQFENGFFDFVYIDDEHNNEGITRSLNAWYPKVKNGGVICGHDYYILDESCDVRKVVNHFFHNREIELNVEDWDWWGIKNGS